MGVKIKVKAGEAQLMGLFPPPTHMLREQEATLSGAALLVTEED